MKTKIKIYSGMSIQKREILKILPNAIVAEPIKRLDLSEDMKNGIHIIGIVDGEFLQNLSVSPTEIMDALRCGLLVYGSSSMGAMRAAELDTFGMIGCGQVYKYIKNSNYFRDDYLGQVYFGDPDSKTVSFTYMDFEMAIAVLAQKNILGTAECGFLLKAYRDLHFSERNLHNLRHFLKSTKYSALLSKRYISQLETTIRRAKYIDALDLIKRIRTDQNQVLLKRTHLV